MLIHELEGEVVFFVGDVFAVCGDIIEVSKAKFDEVLIVNFPLTGVSIVELEARYGPELLTGTSIKQRSFN